MEEEDTDEDIFEEIQKFKEDDDRTIKQFMHIIFGDAVGDEHDAELLSANEALINFESEPGFYEGYLKGMATAAYSNIPFVGSLLGDAAAII